MYNLGFTGGGSLTVSVLSRRIAEAEERSSASVSDAWAVAARVFLGVILWRSDVALAEAQRL